MRLGTQRPFCWRKIEHPWDWGPWCIEAHWSAPGSQRLTFNFSFLAVVMAACLKLLANVRRDLLAHDNGCLYTVCHFISSFPNRVLMRQLGNEATLDLQVRKMTRSQQSDACSFKTWKVTLKTLCKVSITTLLSWWFWCFSWWQQLLCTFFFLAILDLIERYVSDGAFNYQLRWNQNSSLWCSFSDMSFGKWWMWPNRSASLHNNNGLDLHCFFALKALPPNPLFIHTGGRKKHM